MEELRRKLEGITADEELIGKILTLFQTYLKEHNYVQLDDDQSLPKHTLLEAEKHDAK